MFSICLCTLIAEWSYGQGARLLTQAVLVPPEARLFIELNGLGERLPVFRSVFTERILNRPGIPVQDYSQDGLSVLPVWVRAIGGELGLESDEVFDLLFQHQVSLACEKPEDLQSGVLIFRLNNQQVMKKLLSSGTIHEVRKRRGVRVYRSQSGLWLVANRSALAVTQEATRFFDGIVERMETPQHPSLVSREEYIQTVERVRSRRDGVVFVDFGEEASSFPELAPYRCLATGIQVNGLQVDVQLQGIRREARVKVNPPGVRAERIARLPESSLFAWAGWLDFAYWHSLALQEGPHTIRGILARTTGNPERIRQNFFEKIGPRYVLVWDDLSQANPGPLPRIAILIESSNATVARDTLVEALNHLFHGSARPSRGQGDDEQPTIEYNGVQIRGIAPGVNWLAILKAMGFAGNDQEVQICIAELDGWIAISLYPDHMRSLIDGWKQRIRTIGSSGFFDAGRASRTRAVTLGLARPADGLETLRLWFDPLAARDGPLAEFLATDSPGPAERKMLGIGMRVRQTPGQVVISRVYPDGIAAGVLRPGDVIIGVNDSLLALQEPNEDFKKKIRSSSSTTVRLRVLRSNVLSDVSLDLDTERIASSAGSPIEAMKRVMAFFGDIEKAELIILSARPNRLAAQVSFRILPGEQMRLQQEASEVSADRR